MWHAIDTLYGFEVSDRIMFKINAEVLWFNDKDYLDGEFFFESYCNTLFDILEGNESYKKQLHKDVLPPNGCPSLEEVINYKGMIIELLKEQVEKYRGSDWAESDKDIIKWVALKYTFKGDHKSFEKLYCNYKRMGAYTRNESVKQARSKKNLF